MAFTRTSVNPTVIKNILKAVRMAQKHGIAHVLNRKGNAYLAVRKYKDMKTGLIKFSITDINGKNIRKILSYLFNPVLSGVKGITSNVLTVIARLLFPYELKNESLVRL